MIVRNCKNKVKHEMQKLEEIKILRKVDLFNACTQDVVRLENLI